MNAELILSCDAKGNLKHHSQRPPKEEATIPSSFTSLKRTGLILEENIIHVHEDLDPWGSMGVGFDDKRQLVVEMSYSNLSDRFDRRVEYDKRIIISRKGTEKLIDRLNTTLLGLPKEFADEFAYYEEDEDSWNVREVFEIFNEILNYLSCLNIHFRIERHDN